ncbi:MAG TPA: cell division protein ZapA [Allosphingosinicella sp.]|nr:cell division protein ZapA [Allosphingosinicella sp.]
MASVDVEIASRRYAVACRDGEEAHLQAVAAIVDRKARDAAAALGTLSESRHLLFASLLLADELKERREGIGGPVEAEPDPAVAQALERLAERVEELAERLEAAASNP